MMISSTQPTTGPPTRLPTPKPSKRPTTRAPHKRPIRPRRSPTTSPAQTYSPTGSFAVKKNTAEPSVSSSNIQTNPTIFLPLGCDASNDSNLALMQALVPEQSTRNTRVVFPTQDGYISGGIYSGELPLENVKQH